jgi:hypothetical protein
LLCSSQLAEDCDNHKALKLFDVEPPSEEEKAGYLTMIREKHHCQTHREFDYSRCKKDKDGNYIITREDKLPVPFGLDMPEHHIFPHAEESFNARREDGASAIRDLVMLLEQSGKNEVRRDRLANNVEYTFRESGTMNWKKGEDSLENYEKEQERQKKTRSITGRRGSIIK